MSTRTQITLCLLAEYIGRLAQASSDHLEALAALIDADGHRVQNLTLQGLIFYDQNVRAAQSLAAPYLLRPSGPPVVTVTEIITGQVEEFAAPPHAGSDHLPRPTVGYPKVET